MLIELNRCLGLSLAPEKLPLGEAVSVDIDGIDRNNSVMCEIYAHLGTLNKKGQRDKVATDVLKMLLAERHLGGSWRKIYCFNNEAAAAVLRGNSWLARAAKVFGVQEQVVSLTEEVNASLRAAQARQEMVNKS
jgi:hypothetical protein